MIQESTEGADAGPPDFESWCPPELRVAAEQLTPLIYDEMLKMARRERFRFSIGATLTTTSLVHESYLRMAGNPGFDSRAQFLRIATVVMRRVLVDRVRQQLAAKRGSGADHLPLEAADGVVVDDDATVLGVHEALARLAIQSPRLAEVVQCRYFGGYEDREIAEALGVTERTVRRDWVIAKAWLTRELGAPATP